MSVSQLVNQATSVSSSAAIMEFNICSEQYRKHSFMKQIFIFPKISINTLIDTVKTLAQRGFFIDDVDKTIKCYVCKRVMNDYHASDCWYSQLLKTCKTDIRSVRPFERYNHLNFEFNRLITFKDWPITWLSPFDMARSGFYFTRNKDWVACAFCNGIIGDWRKEDTADGEHKRLFPHCTFMNNEVVGNVPISVSQILEKNRCQATIHQQPRIRQHPHINSSAVGSVHLNNLCSLQTRYDSFYGWSIHGVNIWPNNGRGLPRPLDLAYSGFSYCGISDHVVCYSCGIRLHGWNYDDDVDKTHRTWSPNCSHINEEGERKYATTTTTTTTTNDADFFVPKPPPLNEELSHCLLYSPKFSFDDNDIDIMIDTLDFLKEIAGNHVCKIIDIGDDDKKQSLYPYVRKVFKKKLEKSGMLYNTYLEAFDDVCIEVNNTFCM